MKQDLSSRRDRIRELEVKAEAKRHAEQQVEELFNALRLQTEAKAVEHYKECPEHHSELEEYGVGSFLTYFDGVTRVMIKKGLDATLPILAELRNSLVPSEPIHQEVIGASSSVIYAPEAET